MAEYIQVTTTTADKKEADMLAKIIVEKRLASCCQVIGPITSTFWWRGNFENRTEWLCVFKTVSDLYTAFELEIINNHTYEVPEIVSIPINTGLSTYLEWIKKETM